MSQTDAYLDSLPVQNKIVLQHIRDVIHDSVPNVDETFSYDMPAFTYQGKPLIYFAAFKDHLSIFPTAFPIEALKDELVNYKVSKGTIQFTLDNPLSDKLIKKLLKIRIQAIEKGNHL